MSYRPPYRLVAAMAGISIERGAAAAAGGSEWRSWPVVLASVLGIGLGLSPLPFYTAGVFAPHLAAAFGWSIGQIMAGLTVTTLMVVWAGPLVGVLAVRVGVRPVALTSLVLFALAFMALGLSTASLPQFYLTWALVAIFGAGTLPITWTRAVNHRFDRRKGLALGLSLMGTGLFGFASKPYLAWLIGAFGWRWGYVGIGLLPLVIAFPAAFFLFRDTDAPDDRRGSVAVPGGLTLREALRDWRFWLIAVALIPVSLALGGPVPNLENILKQSGLTPAVVLSLTPLVGLAALAGRVVGGWLLDRFWAPGIACVIIGLPSVSCWLLAGATLDYPSAAFAIVVLGLALGVEYDLMAYFIARYFGMRSYTAIYGILYACFSVGAGFGALVYGRAFDLTGSYHGALHVAAGVLIVCAGALLFLGRYRRFADIA